MCNQIYLAFILLTYYSFCHGFIERKKSSCNKNKFLRLDTDYSLRSLKATYHANQ
jgi:hypothetical protein